MGYVEIRPLNENEKTDICDNCNNRALVETGQFVMDKGVAVMWFCSYCSKMMRDKAKQ